MTMGVVWDFYYHLHMTMTIILDFNTHPHMQRIVLASKL